MVNVCPNIYDKALAGIFGGMPTPEALNGHSLLICYSVTHAIKRNNRKG